jgi:glycine hydroxymethyltransferase
MPRVIRASAITAAANSSISPRTLAIDRAKKLFGANFANVQPNSGSQMNQAVFLALLQPGDTFMGLDLAAGGHLTHGSPVNMSGKWFNVALHGVREEDQICSTWMRSPSRPSRHKPKLIIAGGSAYSRIWDFKRFREIADSVGAYLMVDMAHFAGLVAGGVSILRRCRMPTSPPPRPTSRCAARAAA